MNSRIKLRANIPGILNENLSDTEAFQNKVIRPIIKAQHSLLLLVYKNYLQKRKIELANLHKEKKQKIIKSSLTKDIAFKNQVLGLIIGNFEPHEYICYLQKSSDFNKRILQIIFQRITDNLEELL